MIRHYLAPHIRAAIDAEVDRIVATWPPLTEAELADLARIYAPINEAARISAATQKPTRTLRRAA